jgi:hypothetical protein
VSAGRGDEMAAAGAGHGHLRASQGALLSAWQGMGVFCGWTALLLAAGAWLLRRRDACTGGH